MKTAIGLRADVAAGPGNGSTPAHAGGVPPRRPRGRSSASITFVSLCLCVWVGFLPGCQGPRIRGPIRAIWVTRFDYRTPDDVKQIIDDCAAAGFNVILFQVRGNGTAFYRSKLEPWADELGGTDPGWDPLQVACEQAHRRGVALHAYVNAMPAWRGTQPPANPEQLYNRHPEWFWYDQHGNRQALSSFYVSLNPCLPEVRAYIVAVFEDLVSRYDVDGLHLDYIRFPNEPPATPRGSGIDYPRDARTLALFREATGKTPDDDPAAWNRWRTDCVTQVVADTHAMLRRVKPRAVLSAAVAAVRQNGLAHFQDAQQWMQDGLVDAVFLMNYTDSPETFAQRIDPWLEIESQAAVVPGLWFGRHEGKSVEEAAAAVKEQIEIARAKTGHFCLFAYSSLFDSRDQERRQRDERQRQIRQVRRDILLPVLKALAMESR